jgi:hypothetical protein
VSLIIGIEQLVSTSKALSQEWQGKTLEEKASYRLRKHQLHELFVNSNQNWYIGRKNAWKNMCQLVHSLLKDLT